MSDGNEPTPAGAQAPPQPPPDPNQAQSPQANNETKSRRFSMPSGRTLLTWLPLAVLVVWTVFFIKPWKSPAESNADDVALAWNTTMRRLDIDPVYPPQEDLSVGDIYLILDAAHGGAADTDGNLKGRSVKIATLDMRDNFSRRPYTFTFTENDPTTPKIEEASQAPATTNSTDDKSAPVELSITAFPGVDVKTFVGSQASGWNFSLGRKTGQTEEISIPTAETYSVPVVDAVLRLAKFCGEKSTATFCQDDAARKILSYAFGDAVNERVNGAYTFNIRISLIRQVFLTRYIKSQRFRGDGVTAGFKEPANQGAADEGTQTPSKQAATSADYQNRYSNGVKLERPFSRPIAFGFRQVSFALKPNSTNLGNGK
ncbi:hypothetical protein [Rhizobium sp. ZPR3]|uniref:Uncharacterized protein n=2 Tax=unclassified Rhizobium TaxID=2613769 RepID=A0AAU7SF19_9HYPH